MKLCWMQYGATSYGVITITFPLTFTSVYCAIGNGLQTSNFFTADSGVSCKTESLGRIVAGSITTSSMQIQKQNPSYYIVIGI